MIDLKREFFEKKKRLFFSSDVENFNKKMTTISETKRRKHNKNVKFKININNMTTQSKKT